MSSTSPAGRPHPPDRCTRRVWSRIPVDEHRLLVSFCALACESLSAVVAAALHDFLLRHASPAAMAALVRRHGGPLPTGRPALLVVPSASDVRTRHVYARISDDDYRLLQSYASLARTTPSAVLAWAVRLHLQRHATKQAFASLVELYRAPLVSRRARPFGR